MNEQSIGLERIYSVPPPKPTVADCINVIDSFTCYGIDALVPEDPAKSKLRKAAIERLNEIFGVKGEE